jgi:hypothetical protein
MQMVEIQRESLKIQMRNSNAKFGNANGKIKHEINTG